jgi:hypothetical protein
MSWWRLVTLYGAAVHALYVYVIFFHKSTRHLDHHMVPYALDFKEDEWLLMNDVLRMTGATYAGVALLNLILFYCHISVPLKMAFAAYNVFNFGVNFVVYFDHYMNRSSRWKYIRTPTVLNGVGLFLNVLTLLLAVLVRAQSLSAAPETSATPESEVTATGDQAKKQQ